MKILSLNEIKQYIDIDDFILSQRQAFIEASLGNVIQAPIGHIAFEMPPGDCHIKYGYVKGGKHFVVKVATGFYRNPEKQLPVGGGMILVLSTETGIIEALLCDEGYLSDLRTGIAGRIVAELFLKDRMRTIGIVGTGVQARMQLYYLEPFLEGRDVLIWGRDVQKAQQLCDEVQCSASVITSLSELVNQSQYIVTTTPSTEPLIMFCDVRAGTHITAVGADAYGKRELDVKILEHAELIAVDSLNQCCDHGECAYIERNNTMVEIGALLRKPRDTQGITVADLTGIPSQDIFAATSIMKASSFLLKSF